MKLNHTIEQLAAMTVRADSRPLAEDCLALIRENERLREALEKLLHAVCGPTGFAESIRYDCNRAYPWPALDIAEEAARRALGGEP